MKVLAIIVLFFVITSSPQGMKSKYLLIRLRENPGNPRNSNHPQAIGRSLFRSDKSGEQDGLRNEGKECWTTSCNGQGPCAFCGNGLCCMKNFHDTTKGCDGSIGGDGSHQCVGNDMITTTQPATSINGYSAATAVEWCIGNEDLDERNGCVSDAECLQYGRNICDTDPNCFGIAWYKKSGTTSAVKMCRSTAMGPKTDGWRTMMKRVKADYKFIGGCEKGEECFEGFVCGDTDNYAVCSHCSFDECNEHAMKNQSYAFAYKLKNTDMKKGWCRLCNDKEFSKFEKGKDEGHQGWGLYAKKENGIKENWPCGDAHECQCGLECKDKKENGYGTCKRNWSDDNCFWLGTSPFCNPAQCYESGSTQVDGNSYGDGVKCLTGSKRWCCRNC
jgi:hypothetical protein